MTSTTAFSEFDILDGTPPPDSPLAAELVHDLKEPVRSLGVMMEMIWATCPDDMAPSTRERLELLGGLTRTLQERVEQVRHALQTDHLPLRGEYLEPVGLVCRLLGDLRPQLEEAGARVVVRPIPILFGDRVLILRLLQNLLMNSLQHAPADSPPTIRIAGHRCSGGVLVEVSDDGSGIPDDLVERLFERRVHGMHSSGEGLGLAICRRIIERHGGWIRVVPSSDGATFRVFFPDGPNQSDAGCDRYSGRRIRPAWHRFPRFDDDRETGDDPHRYAQPLNG